MTRENYNHGGKYKCLLWWRIGSRTQIRRRKKHLMFDCAYNLIICCMSLCTNFPVYSNCPAKCHILRYVLLLVVRMTLYNLHYRLCHISVIPQTIQSTHIRLSVGQWDTTNSVRQNDTQRKKRQFVFVRDLMDEVMNGSDSWNQTVQKPRKELTVNRQTNW